MLRGQMAPDRRLRPGSGLYAEVICADVPNYSLQLRFAGVCNEGDVLAASGSLLTERYRGGDVNRRPKGVRLRSIELIRPAGGCGTERLFVQ